MSETKHSLDPMQSEAEQAHWLEAGMRQVRLQAFQMKRALDNGSLNDALLHASNMLTEMRTSALSPKNYYQLYMDVFDQLRFLETFFYDEYTRMQNAEEIYEIVQHCGNIVPRLYLLISAGSVYIKTKSAPAKDVLRDMIEMCKGVQHATRGLFLRYYLIQVCKDKLPDVGSEYEGEGGSVEDSIDFILQNFAEMNRLWVRLQSSHVLGKQKKKLEDERLQLRILVGTNLVRLSQLEGVTLELYREKVLPAIIEQVVACQDRIAQQYLMEIIIQVFPDEFHIDTLDSYLDACRNLVTGVDLQLIFTSLADRLANYASQNRSSLPGNVFKTIFADVQIHVKNVAQRVAEEDANMGVEKKVEGASLASLEAALNVEVSLCRLALACDPSDLQSVDTVIDASIEALQSSYNVEESPVSEPAMVRLIQELLHIPMQEFKNILSLLKLENYPSLIPYLPVPQQRLLSVDIIRAALEHGHKLGGIINSGMVNK